MLHVTEYFAKSLKVTENVAVRKLGDGFLVAFHTNCGPIVSRVHTILERDRHQPSQADTHDGIGAGCA